MPLPLIESLRAAYARRARLASICSGVAVLASTGLLDGRRAATHWRYAEAVAAAFPQVTMDASVLYVEADRVYSTAGSAAGTDLLLYVIRQQKGVAAANSVARRLVMPAHRQGGQAQFIERPVLPAHRSRLSPLLEAIQAEPQRDWTVERMAAAAALSPRSLCRHLEAATGLTPGAYLAGVRCAEARRLLEETDWPIEDVARLSGFGSTPTLRMHLARATGLAPREYRARFRPG